MSRIVYTIWTEADVLKQTTKWLPISCAQKKFHHFQKNTGSMKLKYIIISEFDYTKI